MHAPFIFTTRNSSSRRLELDQSRVVSQTFLPCFVSPVDSFPRVEGAKFPLKIFGPTTWKTYAELGDEVHAFGRGLIRLGMAPLPLAASNATIEEFQQLNGPHCLLIFEETCADWMTACIGTLPRVEAAGCESGA